MRDLDAINYAIVRPDTFAAYGFVLLLFSAGFAWVLAWHVSPHLATFSGWLAVCSLVSLPIPRLLRWDWRTYHFGVGFLQFGSRALIHLIPLLSVTLFGRLPPTFAGMFSCRNSVYCLVVSAFFRVLSPSLCRPQALETGLRRRG